MKLAKLLFRTRDENSLVKRNGIILVASVWMEGVMAALCGCHGNPSYRLCSSSRHLTSLSLTLYTPAMKHNGWTNKQTFHTKSGLHSYSSGWLVMAEWRSIEQSDKEFE